MSLQVVYLIFFLIRSWSPPTGLFRGTHLSYIIQDDPRSCYWSFPAWWVKGSTPIFPIQQTRISALCSELEKSGIRVAVGGCSVTERPPYQTDKTVHVQANTLQTRRGRSHGAGSARSWFRTAEPLGERSCENWITTTTLLIIKTRGTSLWELDHNNNYITDH